jgi:ABC-type Fe3+-siderophore transport system permease subunit
MAPKKTWLLTLTLLVVLALVAGCGCRGQMQARFISLFLYLIPVPIFLVACTVGGYHLRVQAIISLFVSRAFGVELWPTPPPEAAMVFFQIRLPRIVLATLVGSALAASGTMLQALFRNRTLACGAKKFLCCRICFSCVKNINCVIPN